MKSKIKYSIRQIEKRENEVLSNFYNNLSVSSIRTFRPLGEKTNSKICEEIVTDNYSDKSPRYDLVAVKDDVIIGWCFVCSLGKDDPSIGLGIADEYHGIGLGTEMMKALMNKCIELDLSIVYLTVVTDNPRAWKVLIDETLKLL